MPKAVTYSAEVRSRVSKSFFFTYDHVMYEDFRKFLELRTWHSKRRYFMCFFISVTSGIKCYPSLVDATGIGVLPRNFRNSLFAATCNNSPSARCVSAANRECKDVSNFRKTITYFLKNILL
jgi:hypothetical protein